MPFPASVPASRSIQTSTPDVSQHSGLTNLGNTCFLNSVLQVLSATRPLHAQLHPDGPYSLPSGPTSAGQRSVSLCARFVSRACIPSLLLSDINQGRCEGGSILETERVGDIHRYLPLTAAFCHLLEKTWKPTSHHEPSRPGGISPKTLLKCLARKHEHLGNYEQQDAHELLRLLLDAMRMEEIDFIKSFGSENNQELRMSGSRAQGSDHCSASQSSLDCRHDALAHAEETTDGGTTGPFSDTMSSQQAQELHMEPLIDVIWGGKLASMVVCEGCRHVSHTYEEFLDLSLPLTADDAGARSRRSSRMRSVTDRWRRPASAGPIFETSHETRDDILRGTTQDETFGSWGVAGTNESGAQYAIVDKNGHQPTRRSASANAHRESRDSLAVAQSNPPPTQTVSSDESVSWSAWAATLGRSRSARHKSSTFQNTDAGRPHFQLDPSSQKAASSTEPHDGSSAPGIRLTNTVQSNVTASLDLDSDSSSHNQKRLRDSRDLLTLLGSASRPSSRASSRCRESDAEGALSRPGSTDKDRRHLPHFSQSARNHPHPKRESSQQAQYIMRVFADATHKGRYMSRSSSHGAHDHDSESSRTLRADIRAAQSSTGLVTAMRLFTTTEVLVDGNAFHCKRCWRRLHPLRGRERESLRKFRASKGKDPSGSEDSDDEVDEMTELAADSEKQTSPRATPLMHPRPQRAIATTFGSVDSSNRTELCASNSQAPTRPATGQSCSSQKLIEADEGADTLKERNSQICTDYQDGGGQDDELCQSPFEKSCSSMLHTGQAEATPNVLVDIESLSLHQDSSQVNDPLSSSKEHGIGSGAAPASSGELKRTGSATNGDLAAAQRLQSCRDHSDVGEEADESGTSTRSGRATESQDLSTLNRRLDTSSSGSHSMPGKRSSRSIARRALKRYLIAEFPPVLVFHLKRFRMTSSKSGLFSGPSEKQQFRKVDDVITFPELLDPSEWQAPPREEYDRAGKLKAVPPRTGSSHTKPAPHESEATAAPLYRLFAVIAHHGSTMQGGHYTAFVRSDRCANYSPTTSSEPTPNSKKQSSEPADAKDQPAHQRVERQWVHCSDTAVRASSLEEVMKCKDAYLLAYERYH